MQGWEARPKARQIVGRAFKSSWQLVCAVPWLLPFTAITFTVVSVAIAKISNLLPASMADELLWTEASRIRSLTYADLIPLQLLELVGLFLKALVGAVPGVLVSRYILLGETAPSPLSKLAPVVWRFAVWTFALDAWFHLWGQAEYLTEWGTALGLAAGLPAYFLLALVFPGIAIGAEYKNVWDRAANGLHHIRGNFWLYLRAIGPLLVAVIIAVAILYLPDFQLNQDRLAQGKTSSSWAFLSWEAVITTTVELVCAAVAAWLYGWVVISRTEQNF